MYGSWPLSAMVSQWFGGKERQLVFGIALSLLAAAAPIHRSLLPYCLLCSWPDSDDISLLNALLMRRIARLPIACQL